MTLEEKSRTVRFAIPQVAVAWLCWLIGLPLFVFAYGLHDVIPDVLSATLSLTSALLIAGGNYWKGRLDEAALKDRLTQSRTGG